MQIFATPKNAPAKDWAYLFLEIYPQIPQQVIHTQTDSLDLSWILDFQNLKPHNWFNHMNPASKTTM